MKQSEHCIIMGLFAHGIAALAAVYGISYGCHYVKDSLTPAPYVSGAHVDESKEYTVQKGNYRMILSGFELKRRPPEMTIDEMLKSRKTIARK